ncbi:YdcF family protein [Chroogloeocystis siderophila]|nr:YdcF family protein [Chroogloeocystis siderophila]
MSDQLSMKFPPQHKYRFVTLAIASLLIILLGIIPLRVAIAHYQAPQPQAILTLGGGIEREKFTAQFAQLYPQLEIWVSSGIPTNQARSIFQQAGISNTRVHIDRRAVDTVTNFTSLISEFQQRYIKHVYLITSDFHMPRAKAIATIIFGSQGIIFTPVSIPSNHPPESQLRILRDSTRAVLWFFTRRTGASFHSR